MYQISRGCQEDFEQIRDFANYVFSQSDGPHDFKQLLPKIYEDGRNSAEYHYLIREDGNIRAMACVIPGMIEAAGRQLKTGCIGTVSVHPYSRGRGYMKILMDKVTRELRQDGYDLAFLEGQRQRYEYFGFEPSGMQLIYTLTDANIRHASDRAGAAAADILLLPLEQGDKWTEAAFELYQQQKVRVIRDKKDFAAILKSWSAIPCTILYQGVFAGYLTLQPEGRINELVLKENKILALLLKPLLSLAGTDRLFIAAALYETERNELLSGIAEACSLQSCHNYSIFDWKKVIYAFLKLKSEYAGLAEGTLVIGIGDETIRITVSGDYSITLEETAEKADIQLSSPEAVTVLLSPAGITAGSSCMKSLNNSQRLCFQTWFPLPLYTAVTDCC